MRDKGLGVPCLLPLPLRDTLATLFPPGREVPSCSWQPMPVWLFLHLQRPQRQRASAPSQLPGSQPVQPNLELRNPSTSSSTHLRDLSFSCIEPFAWVSEIPTPSFGSSDSVTSCICHLHDNVLFFLVTQFFMLNFLCSNN